MSNVLYAHATTIEHVVLATDDAVNDICWKTGSILETLVFG